MWIGACLDQQGDHLGIVVRGRDHEGGDAIGVDRIQLCLVRQQGTRDFHRPMLLQYAHHAVGFRRQLAGDDHEWRQPMCAGRSVHVRARLDEHIRGIELLLFDGERQGCEAARRPQRDGCPMGQQKLYRSGLITLHRAHERRQPVAVGLIDSRPVLYQKLHHLDAAGARGSRQRGLTEIAPSVDIGAFRR